MKDFTIVHLSDLHISGSTEDPSFLRLRESLINDILKMSDENGIIFDSIAVTGDIVDRGGSPEAFNKAEDFFNSLVSKVKMDRSQLVLVPGNHDIPRRPLLKSILGNLDQCGLEDKTSSEQNWEILGTRFKAFFEFSSKFHTIGCESNIFGGGIKDIRTKNGVLRFMLLNSAWSTSGENDYQNLYYGRWQLESIKDQSSKLEPADITLGLSHHPLNWLTPIELQMASEFFGSSNGLKLDALLHGHIHTGGIQSVSDPDHYLTYLVSGIGYPSLEKRSKGMPKLSHCRYAIYRFDLDSGNVEVWTRISRGDGAFVSDTMLYKQGGENGHFEFPFKVNLTKKIKPEENEEKLLIEVDSVPINYDWVGRQNELELLLAPNLRAAAITGMGGQGKTGLAAEFLRRYSRGIDNRFEIGVWLDCRELPDSLHAKIIYLLEILSLGVESVSLYRDEKLKDTIKRFFRRLQSRRYLIVFDNIDAYVNAETEAAMAELQPILNMILDNMHRSFIIFTCRPPFNDYRGSFRQIPLDGLEIPEGVEFFKKRGIEFKIEQDLHFAEEIVELTKGHPLWLGLIAGQIISRQGTFKSIRAKFNTGEVSSPKQFFQDIWKQLKNEHREMLRYLVEAPRPLDETEITIAITEIGPIKIAQQLRRLCRLGLLERHEGTTEDMLVYQVHPLVRQFVHENFTPRDQRPYVYRVLNIVLNEAILKMLFNEQITALGQNSIYISPKDIIFSIETCLNARSFNEALKLLEHYHIDLHASGYHHQFQSLACRVLESVDWKSTTVVRRMKGISLVAEIIYQLILMGKVARSNNYLKRFSSLLTPEDDEYVSYLNVAALSSWQIGKFQDCLKYVEECEQIQKEGSNPSLLYETKALALRDIGKLNEALQIYEKVEITDDSALARKLGNTARCLLKLKNYTDAENLLRQSVELLKTKQDYNAKTNIGYAYLWLAEVLFMKGDLTGKEIALESAQQVWSEYAPGLLSLIDEAESWDLNASNM